MEHKAVETFISRERRYQWIINTLLVVMGFLGGVLFEAERISSQVVIHTVEIRMIRDILDNIQDKLDTLLQERAREPLPADFLAEHTTRNG